MQTIILNTIISITAIIGAVLIGISLYGKDDPLIKKTHPKPQCTEMQHYDTDYRTISEQINKAVNVYQLQHIKDRICSFKKQYAPYQNQFVLHTDWKKLLALWKYKNNSITLLIQLTPDQKN